MRKMERERLTERAREGERGGRSNGIRRPLAGAALDQPGQLSAPERWREREG